MKNFRLGIALLIVVAMNLSLSTVWATPHTDSKSVVIATETHSEIVGGE